MVTNNTIAARATASVLPLQEAPSWTCLPDDLQKRIVELLSVKQAAALASTSKQNNRLVEERYPLRASLLGKAQGPLPKHPRAAFHRLVWPYGGPQVIRWRVEQLQADGQVLSHANLCADEKVFTGAFDLWLERELEKNASRQSLNEVTKRFAQAWHRRSPVLSLTDMPIRSLPPPSSLTDLRQLKLFSCKNLKYLPDGLGDLQALEQLVLCHCHSLVALPLSLGDLRALEQLDLAHCRRLTVLPECLSRLTALRFLHLEACLNLSSLPEHLGELQALQRLNLSDCAALPRLPPHLTQLTALARLDLDGCVSLTDVPEGLGELKARGWLDRPGYSALSYWPGARADD